MVNLASAWRTPVYVHVHITCIDMHQGLTKPLHEYCILTVPQ